MMQTCASCMFFHVKPQWEKEFTAPVGRCRRHAPTTGDNRITYDLPVWPFVSHDMWCGDWSLKAKEMKPQDQNK